MKRVLDQFVFLQPDDFFKELDVTIAALKPPAKDIAQAFRHNLNATLTVSSLPFLLTAAAVHSQRYQAFFMAESIRNLKRIKENAISTEKKEVRAHKRADRKFRKFLASEKGRKEVRDEILERLNNILQDHSISDAPHDLMAQTVIMIWTNIEVLFSDVIISIINSNPKFAQKLSTSDKTKKYFSQKGISIEEMSERGFDVSNSMGDILFSERKLDGVEIIRDICATLAIDDGSLERLLKGSDVWHLFQKRNLIVHRRGIVDKPYIQKTQENIEIGKKLTITSDDIDDYFVLAKKMALGLFTGLPTLK